MRFRGLIRFFAVIDAIFSNALRIYLSRKSTIFLERGKEEQKMGSLYSLGGSERARDGERERDGLRKECSGNGFAVRFIEGPYYINPLSL